jgi:hypothetical protein
LFLLPLCLLPFGAGMLGRYDQEPVALRIYGLVLVAIAVMRVVIWLYATNRPHLCGSGTRSTRTSPNPSRPRDLFCVRGPGPGRATCDACRVPTLSWADTGPIETDVVRCGPVVRGPDVAPVWPCHSRAWNAGLAASASVRAEAYG